MTQLSVGCITHTSRVLSTACIRRSVGDHMYATQVGVMIIHMQLNTLHTCHRWAQAATCLTFLSVSPVLVLMLMPALISVLVLVLVLVVLVLMLSLLVCWDGVCVYIATVSTL